MSRAQRLAYLAIAAVIAVVAVIVLAGGEDPETAATPTRTPTATETATATESPDATETPTPEPTPEAPLLRPGQENELEVTEGEAVRFRVRVNEADEIHVHGYDITRQLQPGRTQ